MGSVAAVDAWAVVTAACATGDVQTTGTGLLSANVLSKAAVASLTRACCVTDDDIDFVLISACLEAVAGVCAVTIDTDTTAPLLASQCGGVAAAVVGVMQRLQRCGDTDGHCNAVRLGCNALQCLARLDSTQQDDIVAAGGVSAVLLAMQRHVDAAAVQESGCGVLQHLVPVRPNVVNATSVVHAGGVDVVLSAMRRFIDNVAVQMAACGALCRLACVDEAAAAIAGAGGIVDAVTSMQRHSTVVDIQCAGGTLLSLLAARSDTNAAAVAAAGGIDVIVAALEHFADSWRLTAPCCDALASVVRHDPEAAARGDRRATTAVRRAKAVVTAMEHNGTCEPLQAAGCRAILSLASPRDVTSEMSVVDVGSVETLIDAMRQCGGSVAVVEHGCAGLRQLVSWLPNSDWLRGTANEAAEAVVAAMLLHEDSAAIQAQCCAALKEIARPRAISWAASAVSGASARRAVDAVLTALRRFSSMEEPDPSVLAYGYSILGILATDNLECSTAIVESGGFELVVDAMRRYPESRAVQRSCCGALAGVIGCGAVTESTVQGAACIALVLAAMHRHNDSRKVHERGCEALRSMASSLGIASSTAIIDAGGVDVVLSVIASPHSAWLVAVNDHVFASACRALAAVASGFRLGVAAAAVAQTKIVDVVLRLAERV
jgi:hypothetical protein